MQRTSVIAMQRTSVIQEEWWDLPAEAEGATHGNQASRTERESA